MGSLAQAERLDGARFDAYSKGKTIYFEDANGFAGAEIYWPNQKVTWTFGDGQCLEGSWREEGSEICFYYIDQPAPHCWNFDLVNNRLRGTSTNDEGTYIQHEIEGVEGRFECPAPYLGVAW